MRTAFQVAKKLLASSDFEKLAARFGIPVHAHFFMRVWAERLQIYLNDCKSI